MRSCGIRPGQILHGALFNEPMRVETVRASGLETWVVGLVGTQSERFRNVTLTHRDPAKFFSRTCFTRALCEHTGMVLRRLAGQTEHTAPVLTLITQFGGGKTHTLTTLFHLARSGATAGDYPGVPALLQDAGLLTVPTARVGVFVGNAWDPQESRETPWIDLARQLAGEQGVAALGPDAILRGKIVEFVGRGDFGLASGAHADCAYERLWYAEPIAPEEVIFEAGIFLVTKAQAQALRSKAQPGPEPTPVLHPDVQPEPTPLCVPERAPMSTTHTTMLRLACTVPPEVWNRVGTKLLPKLRSGTNLSVGVEFSVTLSPELARSMVADLRQILDDLGLTNHMKLEQQT